MILGLVLGLHLVAIVVWLGGLFFVTFVAAPSIGRLDPATARPLWRRLLASFLVFGGASLVVIIATGIAMVFLTFGGYAHIPDLHRVNMMIGIPAIVLFGYIAAVPWRRLRHACDANDDASADRNIRLARALLAIVLGLGLMATIVSGLARYYAF